MLSARKTRRPRLRSASHGRVDRLTDIQPSRPNSRDPSVRESKVTVKIPRPLYRKVQQVVDGSGFNSPTDFIVFVLRDVLGESATPSADKPYSDAELQDVKRKLKNLGYL
jgi:hypothetical protein